MLVDVPMDIFSKKSTSALSTACWPTRGRSRSRTSTSAPPSGSSTRSWRPGLRSSMWAAGSCWRDATTELREFAEHLDHPGRPQPDGQGGACRRPPADPRHDRLLGHQVHQRQVQGRRLDPGPGHALQGSRLQLLGAGIHLRLPADEADPYRYRAQSRSAATSRPKSARLPTSSRR